MKVISSTLSMLLMVVIIIGLVGSIWVFISMRGYKHQFYVFTTSPNPLQGRFVYEKPYGQTFSNFNNGYYDEYSSYIVKLKQ